MMASIFFTERLPGSFIFQTADLLHIARDAQVVRSFALDRPREAAAVPASTRHTFSLPEFIAGEQDVPEPLPQKQGLCQVGKGAVF
jgi:hypothetical protein